MLKDIASLYSDRDRAELQAANLVSSVAVEEARRVRDLQQRGGEPEKSEPQWSVPLVDTPNLTRQMMPEHFHFTRGLSENHGDDDLRAMTVLCLCYCIARDLHGA